MPVHAWVSLLKFSNQVKRALELPLLSNEEGRVAPIREELNALKEVWQSLARFWRELEELRDRRFADVKVCVVDE